MKTGLVLSTVLVLRTWAATMAAGRADIDGPVLTAGPGVTVPELVSKVEPHYTRAALEARIQGSILLEIVIDKFGIPRNINVISPAGFGLDEKAAECVSQWRFKAATKEGHPVSFRAHVEVRFRILGVGFDKKAEERRTRFNLIMSRLQKDPEDKPTQADLTAMEELSDNKLPAAEYLLGMWQVNGSFVPKDIPSGLGNIQKAAGKNYGPALFFIGKSKLDGTFLPKDGKAGLSTVQDAAVLGSKQAQFTLGNMYEKGQDVEQDPDRAKRYFRFCAASGVAECQYRLATLLLRSQPQSGQNQIQAVAWLDLSKDHGLKPAAALADSEAAKLTPAQTHLVERLKPQLERKP